MHDKDERVAQELREDRRGRGAAPAAKVATLGRGAGNRATNALIQAKLTVGAEDDRYEREADRMADRVTRALSSGGVGGIGLPASRIQRSAAGPDPSGPAGGAVDDQTQREISVRAGLGRALPPTVRQAMEGAFEADFAQVRIHDGAEPARLSRSLGARAFTTGRDIYFDRGAYAPHTRRGQHLLAHELTHVVQQGAATATGVQRSTEGAVVQRKRGGGKKKDPPQAAPKGAPAKSPGIMTAEEFRAATKVGRKETRTVIDLGVKRGSTIKEIERVLKEYDKIRPREQGKRRPLKSIAHIDYGLNRVYDIHELCLLWLTDHLTDAGVQALRRPGVERLLHQTLPDKQELEAAREGVKEQRDKLGLGDVPDFLPEQNKFVAKRLGNASSTLEYIGKVIAPAIPNPGDSAEVELSVKIPCEPDGAGYVGMMLSVSASRLSGEATHIGFTAGVTGGVHLPADLVDIGGALTVNIQGQGATPEQAMKLVSWGWYRQLRESSLPKHIANLMWGGSTGGKGARRSEQWAANVEKEAFVDQKGKDDLSSGVGSRATTNQYVRVGGNVGANVAAAKVGGIAGLEGSVELGGGKHYDAESVRNAKGSEIGKAQSQPFTGFNPLGQKSLGTKFITLSTGFSADLGIASGGIAVSLEMMLRKYVEKQERKEGESYYAPEGYLSVEGSFSLALPPGGLLLADLLVDIPKLAEKIKTGVNGIGSKAAGQAGEAGASAAVAAGLKGASGSLMTDLGSGAVDTAAAGLQLTEHALDSTLNVTLAGGYQIGKNWKDAWTFNLIIGTGASLSLTTGLVGLEMARSSKLLRLVLARDEVKPKKGEQEGNAGPKKKWGFTAD